MKMNKSYKAKRAYVAKRVYAANKVYAAKRSWPDSDFWYGLDFSDEEFEDAWDRYLSSPEDSVNSQLDIFPEPSVQGGMGSMFIFDESGNDNEAIVVDFGDWCDSEVEMAASSKSAAEYKKKYREFISDLMDKFGWIQ